MLANAVFPDAREGLKVKVLTRFQADLLVGRSLTARFLCLRNNPQNIDPLNNHLNYRLNVAPSVRCAAVQSAQARTA